MNSKFRTYTLRFAIFVLYVVDFGLIYFCLFLVQHKAREIHPVRLEYTNLAHLPKPPQFSFCLPRWYFVALHLGLQKLGVLDMNTETTLHTRPVIYVRSASFTSSAIGTAHNFHYIHLFFHFRLCTLSIYQMCYSCFYIFQIIIHIQPFWAYRYDFVISIQ